MDSIATPLISVYFGNMVLSDVGLVRNRSTQVGGKSQIKCVFLLCVCFLSFQVIWQTLAHPLLLTLMCRQVCYASQFNVSDSETLLLCFHHRHTYQQRGDPWEQISFLLQLAKKESTLAMLERNITWRQIQYVQLIISLSMESARYLGLKSLFEQGL